MSKATAFKQDTLEGVFDLAYAGAQVSSKIYNNLLVFVDERDLDSASFALEMSKAQDNWKKARAMEALPNNSTLRSSISTIRAALEYKVPLSNSDGTYLGKTALAAAAKEAKESKGELKLTDKQRHTKLKKTMKTLVDLLTDATPEFQEAVARQLITSGTSILGKLGVAITPEKQD